MPVHVLPRWNSRDNISYPTNRQTMFGTIVANEVTGMHNTTHGLEERRRCTEPLEYDPEVALNDELL